MENITEKSLAEFLRQNKKVFLDSMIFIYYFEGYEKKSKQLQCLFNAIEKGETHAFMSLVTISEVLVRPYTLQALDIADEYLRFFNEFPSLTILPFSQETAARAAYVRSKTNLKTPDAIQIAAALTANISGFITSDKQLSSKHLNFFYL